MVVCKPSGPQKLSAYKEHTVSIEESTRLIARPRKIYLPRVYNEGG